MVTDLDWVYFYRQWDGWAKDLVFERRMRLRLKSESVFVFWHIVEMFSILSQQRIPFYHLVSTRWKNSVEFADFYPMPTPWLSIYFAPQTKDAGVLLQRAFHQVSLQ